MSSSVLTRPGLKGSGDYVDDVLRLVKAKDPAQPEFYQAVEEVFEFAECELGLRDQMVHRG